MPGSSEFKRFQDMRGMNGMQFNSGERSQGDQEAQQRMMQNMMTAHHTGGGVGLDESMEKYNLREMNRRNQEQLRMDNIGMSDDESLDFLQDFLVAKGYNKLIPEGLRDKYKREADIEKYLKNMDK